MTGSGPSHKIMLHEDYWFGNTHKSHMLMKLDIVWNFPNCFQLPISSEFFPTSLLFPALIVLRADRQPLYASYHLHILVYTFQQ